MASKKGGGQGPSLYTPRTPHVSSKNIGQTNSSPPIMQQDDTFYRQSEHGISVTVPERGVPDFPHGALPLVVTKQQESSPEADYPASPPLSSMSNSSASPFQGSGSLERQHDAFHTNIQRSFPPPNGFISRRQKARAWHDAILRKRELVLQLLEVQKVIDEVENEAARHLTRDTIARMHQEYYDLVGGNTCDGMFITAISAIRVMS